MATTWLRTVCVRVYAYVCIYIYIYHLISHASAQFAKGISVAHARTTELQPAIDEIMPSIAQTILSKVPRGTNTNTNTASVFRLPARCDCRQAVPKALLVGARHLDEATVQQAVQSLGQRCGCGGTLLCTAALHMHQY